MISLDSNKFSTYMAYYIIKLCRRKASITGRDFIDILEVFEEGAEKEYPDFKAKVESDMKKVETEEMARMMKGDTCTCHEPFDGAGYGKWCNRCSKPMKKEN